MKPQWKIYSDRMSEFLKNLTEFLVEVDSPRTKKAIRKLEKLVNALIVSHNEFSKLVEPIKPIEVKMPFESKKFQEAWTFYKEYLEETHQRFLHSRVESTNLKFLYTISGKNETRAILILEFFIRQQYSTMFLPSEKQLTGENVDTNQPTSGSSMGFSVDAVKREI